jgi:hypothetical protein
VNGSNALPSRREPLRDVPTLAQRNFANQMVRNTREQPSVRLRREQLESLVNLKSIGAHDFSIATLRQFNCQL